MTTHGPASSTKNDGAGNASLLPAPRTDESVPIVNQSPLVPFAIPWQMRPPAHNLVVVVKGTFDIAPGLPCPLSADALPPCGDVRFDNQDTASLRYSSDFVIFKPKADVLLVGHALPSSNPAFAVVSLTLGQLTRSIAVFGDRKWDLLGAQSKPAPFERMALRWERALGGPLSDANPVGRGFGTGVLLPNLERKEALVRSARDAPTPACFAPIAPEWKSRKKKLGSFDKKWLKDQWPFFPADFDWSYFNAAPAEMQLPFLRGDEHFSIAGVLPKHAVLSGTLPGIVPRAFAQHVQTAGGGLVEIPLHLDTVWFDTDAMKLVLVWRGIANTRDEEASEISSLFITSTRCDESLTAAQAQAALREVGEATGVLVSGERAVIHPEEPAVSPPAPPLTTRAGALAWIGSGKPCDGLDLSHVDLSNAMLNGADLSHAILVGANLRSAKLAGAKMTGANLSRVQAEGAVFDGADLVGADLQSAWLQGASFNQAKLGKANLSDAACNAANFSGAIAEQAVFARANLAGAVLDGAQCGGADLTDAKIQDSSWQGAILDQARLYGSSGNKARFDTASMNGARLDGARLGEASFVQIKAEGANWEKAELNGAVFQGANVSRSNFSRAKLNGAVFNKAIAIETCFRKASLRDARMLKSNLMQSTFEGADLTNADLRGANLYQVETWRAKLQGTNLQLANVAGSKLAT